MKKILSIFMCAIFLLALVGCGGQPSNQSDNNKQDASTNSSSDPNSNTSTNSSSDPNSNTSTNSNLSSDTNTNSSSVSGDTKFKLEAAKAVTNFNNPNVVIACWGDSLTEGMAMSKGYTYPQQLQANIGSQYRVINAGVSGERADAILSRANAIEICFRKDVTFAKGEKQCELSQTLFTAVDGGILTYKGFGNELSFNDVLIGGKSYTLEFKKSEKPEEGTFYLIRKDVSSALTIPAGTKVKFDYSSKYSKIHCNIILIGANDGELSAEALIEKYNKLIALNKNYIAIVPYYSEVNVAKEFKKAFGDKALDLREYFLNQADKDYDVELSSMDGYCIKKGIMPTSYLYKNQKGDPHLNELGYKIFADQVYKKGVELGYWK